MFQVSKRRPAVVVQYCGCGCSILVHWYCRGRIRCHHFAPGWHSECWDTWGRRLEISPLVARSLEEAQAAIGLCGQ